MKRILLIALAAAGLSLPAVAEDFSGTWVGHYACDDIVRTMRIDLLPAGATIYSGMLSFAGTDATGRFAIRAATSPDGQTLVAEPSGWLDRPEGFAMVGFTARRGEDVIFGAMSSEQCDSFYARLGPMPSTENQP